MDTRLGLIEERPIWLTLLCSLFWGVEIVAIPMFLCGVVFAKAFHEDELALLYSLPVAYLALLTLSSFGIWQMKKWGAVAYAVFIFFDVAPNIIVQGRLTSFKLMPLFFPFLVSANHFFAKMPELYFVVGVNVAYYGVVIGVGFVIWWLWHSNRLK